MASSGGGAFLPGDPPPSTGQTLTSPTITGTVAGNPAFAGAPSFASGATFPWTVNSVTATGATGSTAANLSTVTPQIVWATGASGAGVNLPTGTPGQVFLLQNLMTGVLKVYAIASTINGASGTTGVSITATGNLTAVASCAVAGAWQVRMNT